MTTEPIATIVERDLRLIEPLSSETVSTLFKVVTDDLKHTPSHHNQALLPQVTRDKCFLGETQNSGSGGATAEGTFLPEGMRQVVANFVLHSIPNYPHTTNLSPSPPPSPRRRR